MYFFSPWKCIINDEFEPMVQLLFLQDWVLNQVHCQSLQLKHCKYINNGLAVHTIWIEEQVNKTYTLSPLMMWRPSCTCSTPWLELNTLSWLSSMIRLMVWSNPFRIPYKTNTNVKNTLVMRFAVTGMLTIKFLPSPVITQTEPVIKKWHIF